MKKTNKLVHLIHNPKAGEGEFAKSELIDLLESHGYRCSYSSSQKKLLKTIEPETEFIVIAGGDGTIKKTITSLLNKKLKHKRPIALLPFGTANNIASALKIPVDHPRNIQSWANYNLKKFDVGQVGGKKDSMYFVEAFGFGLFPKLIKVLRKMDRPSDESPEEEFKLALSTLLALSETYEAVPYKIEAENKTIEGKAIMIEVMNISSLGPHLKLSRAADAEDGYFNLVIVEEKDRSKLQRYIKGKLEMKKPLFNIKSILTKKLTLKWKGKDVHCDDEVIKVTKDSKIQISLLNNLLEIVTETKKI